MEQQGFIGSCREPHLPKTWSSPAVSLRIDPTRNGVVAAVVLLVAAAAILARR